MSNSDYRKPGKRNRASLKRRLIAKHGAVCVGCRLDFGPAALTFDHVVPQSRGGTWAFDNLQLMCLGCNRSKGAA